jgi:hypothetical protein
MDTTWIPASAGMTEREDKVVVQFDFNAASM